jgi:hypothetical protein
MPGPDNKNFYELRSEEVQEVLSKPPGRLIVWGNVLVLLVLVTGCVLLMQIPVPLWKSCMVRVDEVNRTGELLHISCSVQAAPADVIPALKSNVPARLYVGRNMNLNTDYVKITIDTFYKRGDRSFLEAHVPAAATSSLHREMYTRCEWKKETGTVWSRFKFFAAR